MYYSDPEPDLMRGHTAMDSLQPITLGREYAAWQGFIAVCSFY